MVHELLSIANSALQENAPPLLSALYTDPQNMPSKAHTESHLGHASNGPDHVVSNDASQQTSMAPNSTDTVLVDANASKRTAKKRRASPIDGEIKSSKRSKTSASVPAGIASMAEETDIAAGWQPPQGYDIFTLKHNVRHWRQYAADARRRSYIQADDEGPDAVVYQISPARGGDLVSTDPTGPPSYDVEDDTNDSGEFQVVDYQYAEVPSVFTSPPPGNQEVVGLPEHDGQERSDMRRGDPTKKFMVTYGGLPKPTSPLGVEYPLLNPFPNDMPPSPPGKGKGKKRRRGPAPFRIHEDPTIPEDNRVERAVTYVLTEGDFQKENVRGGRL
ncbi:hypothetical protein K402DRAFT_389790 [Aulographum hederae CBS 113979]|uniref:Uncharacterized protein n=1 Tax=Aulographum hederae CBS 113979 TaxID=1176131 RepID=A0A6G1HCZ3_9PEZI|nr:hypothetical protein K402DRAFT_389790 [Aulographum hederae CBS 113979]